MSLQQNVGWSIRFFFLALLLVPRVGAAEAAGLDQAWLDSVAALDPQKQVEAVTAKMRELNPGSRKCPMPSSRTATLSSLISTPPTPRISTPAGPQRPSEIGH
jgi:hypothetical protein